MARAAINSLANAKIGRVSRIALSWCQLHLIYSFKNGNEVPLDRCGHPRAEQAVEVPRCCHCKEQHEKTNDPRVELLAASEERHAHLTGPCKDESSDRKRSILHARKARGLDYVKVLNSLKRLELRRTSNLRKATSCLCRSSHSYRWCLHPVC